MDNLIENLVDDNLNLQDQLIEKRRQLAEGVVANTDKESESQAIKKLTEEEDEDYSKDVEEDMEEDVEEEAPEDEENAEDADEVDKEYFGQAGDTSYYLVGFESEEGNVEDLQIVDQEGEKVFSAKDNEVEVTDVADFIIQAIQEMEIEDISYDVFEKYILPKLVEPEEEEEEESFEDEEDFGEEDGDLIPDEEEAETFEAIKTVYSYKGKKYTVALLAENKVQVGNKIYPLSKATLGFYNISEGNADEKDLQDLAKDMLRAMNERELDELKEGMEDDQYNYGEDVDESQVVPNFCEECDAELDDADENGDVKCSKCGHMNRPNDVPPGLEERKVNEDITSDVKDLQKKAEAAVKAGEYMKAADYVNRLANVETSIGNVEEDNGLETLDEPAEPVEDEESVEDVAEEVLEDEVDESKTKQIPEDIQKQVDYLNTFLNEGMYR